MNYLKESRGDDNCIATSSKLCGSQITTQRVPQQNGSHISTSHNGSDKESLTTPSSLSNLSPETATLEDHSALSVPSLDSPNENDCVIQQSSDNSTSVVLFNVEIANKRIENVPVRADCRLGHIVHVLRVHESVRVVYFLYEKLQKKEKESCDIEDAEGKSA